MREFQVWAWTCWDLEKTARANALAAFRATLPTPRSALESCVLNGLLFTAEQWCEKAGRRSASESGDARRLLVNRAFAVADDNAPVCLTVDDLARALSVHPRTLNRAFQTVCGTSVGNALQQRQFETAQALVAEMKVEAAAAMIEDEPHRTSSLVPLAGGLHAGCMASNSGRSAC